MSKNEVMETANQTMSRLEFLKKGFLGMLGVAVVAKGALSTSEAASVRDNLNSGGAGIEVGATAPTNKKKLWIDTSKSGRGVVKYWNGSKWSATASVWDE